MTAMSDGRVPVPRDPEDDYTRRGGGRPPGVREERTGASLRARVALLVRPRRAGREHRALHRRGPGADRRRRTAAGQRRAREGRVLRAAGHRRGHAGGQLQPRDEAAPRGRRREDDGDGRRDAARPGFVFGAPARRARSANGWTRPSTRSRPPPRRPRARASSDIEQYSASRMLFTRFNYTTGDAAGQNLTGKATAAACAWITSNYDGDRALLPGVELRDRQEELAGQHAAHARQAGGGGGDDPGRADPASTDALHERAAVRRARRCRTWAGSWRA